MPRTYDDVETLVRSRQVADAIMRDLATVLPPPLPPPTVEVQEAEIELLPPPPAAPLDLSTPPAFATPLRAAPKTTTVRTAKRRRRTRRREGTKLHWAVLAMAAAIGVGLWLDPPARTNAVAQLQVTGQKLTVAGAGLYARVGALRAR